MSSDNPSQSFEPESASASPSELDPLFQRLRAEPPPDAVGQTAFGLPTRVAARLREETAPVGTACLRWACGLAPFTAACVAWAVLSVNELKLSALADPQTAGWLMMLLG